MKSNVDKFLILTIYKNKRFSQISLISVRIALITLTQLRNIEHKIILAFI